MDLLMLCKAGSHLYGTNTPESDLDLRGVVLEDDDVIFGMNRFEQLEGTAALKFLSNCGMDYPEGTDITLYGLKKFCKLASDGNPNIVELLFAPTIFEHRWHVIKENANLFLSKRYINRFAGYIASQRNGVKSRKDWIENPPIKPEPSDYGLTVGQGNVWASSISKKIYDSALLNYNNYQRWLKERNPKRLALELEHGYDTKAAMHVYRLYAELIELISTGKIEFPLLGARYLVEIKNGKSPYGDKDVIQGIEFMINDLNNEEGVVRSLSKNHKIKELPDIYEINKLMQHIYYSMRG